MSRTGCPRQLGRGVAPGSVVSRALLAAVIVTALVACNGGGGPSTLSVKGLVRGAFREPIPGVVVVVHGVGTDTTGADGRFQVDGVSAPYDVTVLDPVAGWAHTFLGVSTGAPELFPIASLLLPAGVATATVTGELDAPVPADHEAYVCVHGVDETVYGCGHVLGGESSYAIAVRWLGDPTTDARLRAIEYEQDPMTLSPTALTGSTASEVFTLTEGGVSDVDLIMGVAGPVTTFTVEVTPDFSPDGYAGVALTHIDQFATLGITGFDSDTPSLTVFTPRFTGAAYTVAGGAYTDAGASSVHWRTGVPAGATLQFDVPAPAVPLAPAEGAADVGTGTTFRVSNPAGGAMTVVFSPESDGPMIAVTSLEESFTLPDLSEHGLPLPPAVKYYWGVYAVPSVTDMNAAVTGTGYLDGYELIALALNSGGPQPGRDGRISLSGTRTFTTAP